MGISPFELQAGPVSEDELVIRLLRYCVLVQVHGLVQLPEPVQAPIAPIVSKERVQKNKSGCVNLRSHLDLYRVAGLLDVGVTLQDPSELSVIQSSQEVRIDMP